MAKAKNTIKSAPVLKATNNEEITPFVPDVNTGRYTQPLDAVVSFSPQCTANLTMSLDAPEYTTGVLEVVIVDERTGKKLIGTCDLMEGE